MKKTCKILSLLICLSLLLCGCMGNTISYDKYADLEAAYEECENERDHFEEELNFKEKNIDGILNYLKSIEVTESIINYNFDDIWSVEDYFNFSFYYDEEFDSLSYKVTDKEGSSVIFIDEYTKELQNLFIGVYRSDGLFESYNAYGSDDVLFYIPQYNYAYEIIVIATVNNVPYRVTYKMSCEDIKNQ